MSRTPQASKPGVQTFDRDLAREMYSDGVSLADLGRFFNVTPAAVRFGIERLNYDETGVWNGPPSQRPGIGRTKPRPRVPHSRKAY